MEQAMLDKEAFCAQVMAHQDAMFRTAKAILRRDEDAEDAVQEAICAAYAARSALRDPERFKPWILRILTNKCYDACRRQRPRLALRSPPPSILEPLGSDAGLFCASIFPALMVA